MTEMITLAHLGTLRNGMNYGKSSAINGCKIIGVADFGNKVFPDYELLEEIDSNIVSDEDLLREGDILFVRSNGNKNLVGRSMFIRDISEPVCYSGFCILLRPNQEIILPEYLFYALRAPFCRKQYSCSQQTNITNLSQAVLGSVVVPVPDYSEQRRTAKILYDIDRKIENNNLVCFELEALAKTLYDYWFVQFDFPDENGKPYRTSGGEMVWNKQIKREIPKGWDVTTIGKILAKVTNTPRILTSEYMSDGPVPIIDQSAEFIVGYTDSKEAVLTSESGYIVFGDHTRIVKYVRFPFARGADGTQILKSNDERVPEELFYQMIRSVDLSNYGYARHFKFLKDSMIVLPEKNIADYYVNSVKSMYKKQVQLIFENIELAKLRDWLLPVLMNGQARVE